MVTLMDGFKCWIRQRRRVNGEKREAEKGNCFCFFLLLEQLWETSSSLNITDLSHSSSVFNKSRRFTVFVFLPRAFAVLVLLQPITRGPFILYACLGSGTRVTAYWKRVIEFYFYHQTHRGMKRRGCGWKRSER